jgi:hypothetical protein
MDPPTENESIPEPKARMEPPEAQSDSETETETETEKSPAPTSPPVSSEMPTGSPPLPPPQPEESTPEEVVAEVAALTLDAKTDGVPPAAATFTKDTDANDTKAPSTPPKQLSTSTSTSATSAPDQLPVMSPLSPKERLTSFDELRSYEAKRRAIYSKKLKSTSLYWRAFRDTLSKSYSETERAETLIAGALHANTNYANYLEAGAQDRLDYSGKPMEVRKASIFRNEKRKKYSALGGASVLWNVAMSDEKQKSFTMDNSGVENAIPHIPSNTGASFDGLQDESLLTSFIESHNLMALKFRENCIFVRDVALKKTVELRKELEAEVSIMSMLGDAMVYELEKADDDVTRAWGELCYVEIY